MNEKKQHKPLLLCSIIELFEKSGSDKKFRNKNIFRKGYQVSTTNHWRTIGVRYRTSYKIAIEFFNAG